MLMLVVEEVELGGRGGKVVFMLDVCCFRQIIIRLWNKSAFTTHKEDIST